MNRLNVGECLLVGFRGLTIPDWVRELASRYGLGGVILFDYNCQTKSYDNNIASPEQVARLCNEIHALPSNPLLFVDQEGGKVRRLKESKGFAPLPSHQNFPSLPISDRQQLVTSSLAEQRRLGFHFDLAPVIDLNYNPKNPDIGAVERSFGEDPESVREQFAIWNEAAKQTGMGLCLKHFPGLGGATVNSHHELTDLTGTVTDEQLELFYELGNQIQGSAILVSHGIVNDWEREVPVSMSQVAISKLRARLPDALLITDDIQMQALQQKFPTRVACERAIDVGLDLICIGNNLMTDDAGLLDAAEGLRRKAGESADFLAKIEKSIFRIQQIKKQFSTHA